MRLGTSIRRRRAGKGAGPSLKTYRRLGLALGLSLVGFGLGFLIATRVLFPAQGVPDDLVEVPELRGLELSEVQERLRESGLLLSGADSLRHPSVPEGRVLGQSPLPGQLTLPAGSVRVTLSRGPERRAIPDVFRLRAGEARVILEATGFHVLEDSAGNRLPRGSVIGVEPSPGTEVALPSEVRLTVSIGPPMVEVPDLQRLSEEEARAAIDSVGLVISEVEERFRFGMDQGTVLEQTPPPGTLVERGSAIRLVVGRRRGG